MLMRVQRLLEARSISSAALLVPASATRWTGLTATISGIQHHEREPPVTLQRILQMEIDDGLLLLVFQPKVPGNPTVVFVDAAVAFSPIVELAAAQPNHPTNRPAPISLASDQRRTKSTI
jgi:hypothetical protein